MAKANIDGWIEFRGGEMPVDGETLVDIIYRGEPEDIEQDIWKGIPANFSSWHFSGKSKWDVLYYRIHTATQQESQHITAEQIRTKYIENLASIADLHNQNAALVDDLHKLGFDFYDAPKEPQEDMSDPRNWRAGDAVQAIKTTGDQFVSGDIYVIKELDWRAKNDCVVCVEEDSSGSRTNGWGSNNFVWHSRPTK